jgi:hypothetical protein
MTKLNDMVQNLIARDKKMVDEMNGWMGDGMTLEKRIVLADARAMDALGAAMFLARYIDELEARLATQGEKP